MENFYSHIQFSGDPINVNRFGIVPTLENYTFPENFDPNKPVYCGSSLFEVDMQVIKCIDLVHSIVKYQDWIHEDEENRNKNE
jgi:hypothetical protein